MEKLSMFIASSTHGVEIARALLEHLEEKFEVEIWNQGSFTLGDFTLEALINASHKHQFAVLILTPDDTLIVKDTVKPAPRDNLIFELGFFTGTLGRKQAFIVHPEDADIKLPSDIDGVTRATYSLPKNRSLVDALTKAANKIKTAAFGKGEDSYYRKKVLAEKKEELLIHSILKTHCNALSIPKAPTESKIRAFVFKKDLDKLICSHFWAPYPVKEVIGQLMFGINAETEKQVAVVKSAIKKEVCASHISVLTNETKEAGDVHGEIDDDLCFVLAAPIIAPDGNVWGIVDFDASSKEAEEILNQEVTKSFLFELGKQLSGLLHHNHVEQ